MYVRYVATPSPTAARTIIVILSVRALIAVLTFQQLVDRRFEGRRIAERGVCELLQLSAGLSDQEGWRAGESGVVGRLRIRRDLIGELRVVARRGPAREVQPRHLLGEALEVLLGHVFAALLTLLVVEELGVVPQLLLL